MTVCRQFVGKTLLPLRYYKGAVWSIRGHAHFATFPPPRSSRVERSPQPSVPYHQAATALEAGGYTESCILLATSYWSRHSLACLQPAQPLCQAGPQPQTRRLGVSRGTSFQSSAQIAQGITVAVRSPLQSPLTPHHIASVTIPKLSRPRSPAG